MLICTMLMIEVIIMMITRIIMMTMRSKRKKTGGGVGGIIFPYRSLHVKEKNNWINVPLTSAVFSSKSRASASIDAQD